MRALFKEKLLQIWAFLRPDLIQFSQPAKAQFVAASLKARGIALAEVGTILSAAFHLTAMVTDLLVVKSAFLYRLFVIQHLSVVALVVFHQKILKPRGLKALRLTPLYQLLSISVYIYAVWFGASGQSTHPFGEAMAWIAYTSVAGAIIVLAPWSGIGVFYLTAVFSVIGFGIAATTSGNMGISQVSFFCIVMSLLMQRTAVFRVVRFAESEFKTQQLTIELERARAQRDMELARDIQDSLRIKDPMNIGMFRVDFMFQRKSAVGGDWYAVRAGTGNEVFILVADAAGSGVHAALVLHVLQSLWASALEQSSFDPASWLLAVNNTLVTLGRREPQSVTAAILRISDQAVSYWSAGHVPCFVATGDNDELHVRTLAGRGTILGIQRDISFRPAHMFIAGDQRQRILLASDGVFPNAFAVSRRRLKQLLTILDGIESKMAEGAVELLSNVNDDRTMIVLDNRAPSLHRKHAG